MSSAVSSSRKAGRASRKDSLQQDVAAFHHLPLLSSKAETEVGEVYREDAGNISIVLSWVIEKLCKGSGNLSSCP